jgi:hypothetical protein
MRRLRRLTALLVGLLLLPGNLAEGSVLCELQHATGHVQSPAAQTGDAAASPHIHMEGEMALGAMEGEMAHVAGHAAFAGTPSHAEGPCSDASGSAGKCAMMTACGPTVAFAPAASSRTTLASADHRGIASEQASAPTRSVSPDVPPPRA